MYALNASTGALIWKYTTGDEVDMSPAVANGVVYVVSSHNYLYALNASTGALLWKYTAGDVESSPTVANGVVYVGAADDESVYALNAVTGALIWKYGTGGGVDYSPAVANGVVYFSDGGSVYALNAMTGALIWKYTPEAYVDSSPAVVNGVVYIGVKYSGNDPPGLYALNASTGALLWAFYTEGVIGGDGCDGPTVANGVVYIGCYSFYAGTAVYALDVATQGIVWASGFRGGTPVVANGVAYVGMALMLLMRARERSCGTGRRAFIRRWWPTAWCTPVLATVFTAFHLPNQQMSEKFSPPERPDPARLTPNWGLQPNTAVTPTKK